MKILLLILISIFFLGCGQSARDNPPRRKPGEKPIAITALQLTEEYSENREAADKKYQDKLLAVTGKVGLIYHKNMISVGLRVEQKLVHCFLQGEAAKTEAAQNLNIGQEITLEGYGLGADSENRTILMSECQIIK